MKALGALGEGLVELSFSRDGAPPALGFGGDAANVCVMAARLGTPARLAGRVGDDELGRRLIGFWRDQRIDVAHLRRDADAATGLYLNEPRDDGHRFVYHRTRSAGSRLAPGDIPPAFFDDLGILVVTGVTLAVSGSSASAARHSAAVARGRGAQVACVLNHRPALGGDVAELAALARACDIVIGSREDTEAVLGTRDAERVLDRLAGVPEIVLSDGAAPAVAIVGGEPIVQPVPPSVVRNAGGAGDALAGAYLASRLGGHAPAQSLAVGVAAASISVRRDGCASAYPTAEETLALLDSMAPA